MCAKPFSPKYSDTKLILFKLLISHILTVLLLVSSVVIRWVPASLSQALCAYPSHGIVAIGVEISVKLDKS